MCHATFISKMFYQPFRRCHTKLRLRSNSLHSNERKLFTSLRESDPEIHEFAVKTEISDSSYLVRRNPLVIYLRKLQLNFPKSFCFREIRQNMKCRTYYVAVMKFYRDLVHFQSARGGRWLNVLT